VGYNKIAILISILLHRVLSTLQLLGVINTVRPDRSKLMTLIAAGRYE